MLFKEANKKTKDTLHNSKNITFVSTKKFKMQGLPHAIKRGENPIP
jgi:hypothetical protein